MELGNLEGVAPLLGLTHRGVPGCDHRDGGQDLIPLPLGGKLPQLPRREEAHSPLGLHLIAGGFGGQTDRPGLVGEGIQGLLPRLHGVEPEEQKDQDGGKNHPE